MTMVNIAWDRDDLVFMAVAPVARDAEPCSRHAAMSAVEFTLISFKPLIYQSKNQRDGLIIVQ
jgi:hypothetical protein